MYNFETPNSWILFCVCLFHDNLLWVHRMNLLTEYFIQKFDHYIDDDDDFWTPKPVSEKKEIRLFSSFECILVMMRILNLRWSIYNILQYLVFGNWHNNTQINLKIDTDGFIICAKWNIWRKIGNFWTNIKKMVVFCVQWCIN